MHPKILLSGLSILLPLTQAQTTTTSPSSTPTTLPALLAVFPHCALGCLASAATSINCAATDFACLCSKSSDLVSKVGPCIISGSGCSPGDINQIRNLAPSLCNIVNADKNATDVSAASNLVSAALATVTGTPTASGNAAVRTGAALGVMGMGIAGAVAVLGL